MEEGDESEYWNWKHILVDMVWNVFSISSRVIALAFFASFELYWFWGILGFQITIAILISFLNGWSSDNKAFLSNHHSFLI